MIRVENIVTGTPAKVPIANEIPKIEEGIYALFDAKGKLSFVAPDEEGTTSILPLKNKIEAQ